MNVEHSYWEETFLALRQTILEADTIDVLMRKALCIISTAYRAEGVLWVGLEAASPESCRAYATTQAWRAAGDRHKFLSRRPGSDLMVSSSQEPGQNGSEIKKPPAMNTPDTSSECLVSSGLVSSGLVSSGIVRRFRPAALPLWLLNQRSEPQLIQLETGDVILPITEVKGYSALGARSSESLRPSSTAREVSETKEASNDIEPDSNLAKLPYPQPNQHLRFVFQFWRSDSKEIDSKEIDSKETGSDAIGKPWSFQSAAPFESSRTELQDSQVTTPEPQPLGSSPIQALLLSSKTDLVSLSPLTPNQAQQSAYSLAESLAAESLAIFNAKPEKQGLNAMQGWTPEEIRSLRASCNLLLLASDALSWKRRAEQAQEHTSILSCTSHLLNSSFHPDVIVSKILAQIGKSIRCDRAIVVDLRNQIANLLSLWERPRHSLHGFEEGEMSYSLWQDTVDLFVQGGASYIEITLTNEESEPLQRWLSKSGAGSALVLPIFIRDSFLGTIVLLSHRRERNYFLDELQIAGQGAEQLAIALSMIQNTRSTLMGRDNRSLQATPSGQEQFQDGLTGLPNLQALEQELNQLSAPSIWAFHNPFSLIICDLDYFKLVNDTHGSDIGDRVLERLAQRLQRQLRRSTPLYRYGGEEFVVFLENTELEKAKDVAERLRRSIHSMNLKTTSGSLELTASFGVAQQQPRYDRSALDVLKRAEKALFEAKRLGRDRVSAICAS
ncbi:MAG: sensor domain-containing diguanylate cyclase [Elainellaceae cyanobacterium]